MLSAFSTAIPNGANTSRGIPGLQIANRSSIRPNTAFNTINIEQRLQVIGNCVKMSDTKMSLEEKQSQLEAVCANISNKFPNVPEYTVEQLSTELNSGDSNIVVVDTRSPEEQKVSKIKGNVVTLQDFQRQNKQYTDKKVVMYCTVGMRSAFEADRLINQGFDAYNLRGSILAWTQAKLPLVDSEGKDTKDIHTFSPQMELQGDGYTPVSFKNPKPRFMMVVAKQSVLGFFGKFGKPKTKKPTETTAQ